MLADLPLPDDPANDHLEVVESDLDEQGVVSAHSFVRPSSGGGSRHSSHGCGVAGGAKGGASAAGVLGGFGGCFSGAPWWYARKCGETTSYPSWDLSLLRAGGDTRLERDYSTVKVMSSTGKSSDVVKLAGTPPPEVMIVENCRAPAPKNVYDVPDQASDSPTATGTQ